MSGVEERMREDVAAIKDKLGVLSAADAPTTTEECRRLAVDHPDKFNALLDQGLIPAEVLGGKEE